MTNLKMTVKGNILTMEVDLSKTSGPSASGKTEVIASTGGTAKLDGHDGVILNVNVNKKIAK